MSQRALLSARLPAVFEDLRRDRATIVRATDSGDGMGGTTATPRTVASNVPVSVYALLQRDVLVAVAAALQGRVAYGLNFAADVDIRAQDRVTVGSTPYHVLGVANGSAYRGLGLEAQAVVES
jgi:hypothetical protein